MIDYKQPRIIEELRNRILDGTYTAQLPTTAELAAEFGVNIKTMGKAIGHHWWRKDGWNGANGAAPGSKQCRQPKKAG